MNHEAANNSAPTASANTAPVNCILRLLLPPWRLGTKVRMASEPTVEGLSDGAVAAEWAFAGIVIIGVILELRSPVAGDWLVAGGIAFEVLAGMVAHLCSGELTRRSTRKLSEATSRLADLEVENGYITERLAVATTGLSRTQAELTRANERAAKLEKEAAEARLETEKLKGIVAWRTLPPTQAGALERCLGERPGSVNLKYMDGDPEALFLAIQLGNIFGKANWKVAPSSVKLGAMIVFGLALPDTAGTDAQTLRMVFDAVKIPYSTTPVPQAGFSFGAMEISGAPTLMVGSRMPTTL